MVLPDKVIKKQFLKIFNKDPDKYYATDVLRKEGFSRACCEKCGTYFWSVDGERKVCGDASCQGGFTFLNNNPSSVKLSYIDVWNKFSTQFTQSGYKAINRYPVIARWNPTTDFTMASIAAFQPFVINGQAKAPAEKLVIPQFCLRFGDVDNVGVTMSHLTGFVMIGQHQFVAPDKWNQDEAFEEIFTWVTQGLGLPKEEITFHEDGWAGGGNFGPSMEFFSRGVELGNQVYMMFEQDDDASDGYRELKLKVLDMGMGHERNAWFSQGATTIYDATFPQVIEKLINLTGVEYDREFIRSYVPYGAYLNLDEIDDLGKAWRDVASKMNVEAEVLQKKLHPMTAIFSIAEHARSLLFALSDGGLPSNVGGGYNLRVILRRALSFIDEYNWNVDMYDVCTWHAKELADIYPELEDALGDVKKILASEKIKFLEGRKRNKQIIENILNKGIPNVDKLISLYDSQGITPEEIVLAGRKRDVIVEIPDNFYSLVTEFHENKEVEQASQTKKKTIIQVSSDIDATEILYFDEWKIEEFEAKVVDIIDNYVILDKSAFYPTSGGQQNDLGTINGVELVDCIKQGKYTLHKVNGGKFTVGDVVKCTIDIDRRRQLTQHHSATHVINGVAKRILGDHIWQAGASKSVKKARLDITHFDALDSNTLKVIESEANKIIAENLIVEKGLFLRDEAEEKYGFRLYQGGAVPGGMLRVVNIDGLDVEACGGTHVNSTSEIEKIKILKSTKVQDGVVRIEFVAGKAAFDEENKDGNLLVDACKALDCEPNQLPARASELFVKWKKAKKGKLPLADFVLSSNETFDGDVLLEISKILKTQVEHVVKTLGKFLSQLEGFKSKAKE